MDYNALISFLITLSGLCLIVFSNNLIGSLNALASGTFDKNTCIKGLIKAGGLVGGIVIAYIAGMLAPEISIGMVNGVSMSMREAVSAIITGAYGIYGYKFIQKCIETLQLKINITNSDGYDETSTQQRGN